MLREEVEVCVVVNGRRREMPGKGGGRKESRGPGATWKPAKEWSRALTALRQGGKKGRRTGQVM